MFSTKKSDEQSSGGGVDIFSLNESKLSELLKEIKEKCGSGKLPDEISHLISPLDSMLGKLLAIQHESSPALIEEVMVAIKSVKRDLEHWYDHIKTLTEDQERLKKITGAAIETEQEANGKALKRLVTELDTFFENIREQGEKARLLANAQVEEFIKRSQEHEYKLLSEIEDLNKQIRLEKGHLNELKQRVLDSGFLARVQAAHPLISPQKLQNEFDRYFDDPKARAGKKLNGFAEGLGVKKEEIDGYIRELNIKGNTQEIEISVEKIDTSEELATQRSTKLVESWVVDIKAIEALKIPGAKQKYLESRSDVISKCNLETFTAFFEQRAKEIAAVTSEHKGIPKDSPNEAEQTKREDLEEKIGDLSDDLKGVTQLVKQRFGEKSTEFTEMQGKVEALEGQMVAPVVPTPVAQLHGAVLGGTTAVVSPAQPQKTPDEAKGSEEELKSLKAKIKAAEAKDDDDEAEKLKKQLEELEQKLKAEGAGQKLPEPMPPPSSAPSPVVTSPAPVVTPPAVTPPVTPQATEKEASVKAAAGLLTLERACAILGYPAPDAAATPEAKKAAMKPMIKSCVDQGEKAITQIGKFNATLKSVDQPLANSMRQEFRSMTAELKKPLPIYDLDFTKPEVVRQKIKESVEKTLPTWEEFAKKSGIDIQAYNADKNLPKYAALKKAEEEFGHLRDAAIDLRVLQYAVGAEGMDIEAKDANTDKEWEARLNRIRDDKSYADIAALGLADENFAKEWHRLHDKLGPDAYLARLKSETKEVIENELFSKMDGAGNTVFIVKVVNEHTLQTVIEAKKDQKEIAWSNADPKDVKLIETQCLANWKKVTFDGHETDLSKLMPERQADWKGWVKNIAEEKTMGWYKRNQNMKRLVQKVVGNDPKRLREFMLDLRDASKENRAYAVGYLTDQQRGVLQQEYLKQLEKLKQDKLDLALTQLSQADKDDKSAQIDADVANLTRDLEVFAEGDPKMAARALAVAPSIGEHYIARLDKLETKLENAKKPLKPNAEPSQKVKDAKAVMENALIAVKKLAPASPVQGQPAPSKELKEYLQVREQVLKAVEDAKADPESKSNAQYIAELRAQVTTLANKVVAPTEQVAVKDLVEADKKLLQVEEESKKEANDDTEKLTAEIAAAKTGLLKVAGTDPALLQKFWAKYSAPETKPGVPVNQQKHFEELKAVSEMLAPDQQEALKSGYVKLLPELSKDLSKAEKDTAEARNGLEKKLTEVEISPSPSESLIEYINKQRELVDEQDNLEDAKSRLREEEEALAEEKGKQNPDETKIEEINKKITATKAKIEATEKAIADLQAQVAKAKEVVKDPNNPKAEKETKDIEEVEKLAQGLLGKREKQKKTAGELAAAERSLGELVGSTNMPASVAKVVTTAVKNTSSLAMVMKFAQGVSDALHPAEAKKLKTEAEKQSAEKPGTAPKQQPQ